MTEPLTSDEILAAARLAGVRLSDRERQSIAQTLGGFLAAVRGIPAPRSVEPAATFTPEGERPGGR